MKTDDRRKFQRIDFEGMADLQFLNYNFDCCQVKNLSLTGMFVEGDFQRRKAKNCQIKLFHHNSSGYNSFQASAEVVWKSRKGAGLRFTAMSFENYLLLQTTLIDYADDPETILRELPKDSPYFISGM